MNTLNTATSVGALGFLGGRAWRGFCVAAGIVLSIGTHNSLGGDGKNSVFLRTDGGGSEAADLSSGEKPQAKDDDGRRADSGSQGALLEGGWEPYDATPLSVKRSITVERDGSQYEADVYTPVLTRRGAIFLNAEQIAEMKTIRQEVSKLVDETRRIQDSARKLSERYSALIAKAKAGMVETEEVEKHRGKVEFVSREEN